MVKKVRKRLKRNPRRSANKMAKDLKISDRSVRRILENKLKTNPYKIQKVHQLTNEQKKLRVKKAKELKRRAASGHLENIVFSDEKVFTVQQVLNKQNDRVWLVERSFKDFEHLTATRTQKPASVMVWAGITRNGRTPLIFLPKSVKIDQKHYRELILEGCLKPWAQKHFKSELWTF